MFQLFELIFSSAIGAFVFSVLRDTVYAAMIISDCDECGFNDLGKLLFGGLLLALLVGVGASVVWWKRKEKGPAESSFVSIRSDKSQKPDR